MPCAASPRRSAAGPDLAGLFEDVLDESIALFGVDRAGLWLYDPTDPTPLSLAAGRGMSSVIIEAIASLPARRPHDRHAGAARPQGPGPRSGDAHDDADPPRRCTARSGSRRSATCRWSSATKPLGLLVLYHPTPYAWTADERALARAFGDHMATAIGSARLADSGRTLASRLTSIAELAGRLGHLQDLDGIAWAIVGEARRLIDHDTIRVYRVDHAEGTCEPIAFQGTFLGSANPDPADLRVAIGEGFTGWVAAHGRSLRLGDAGNDPRGIAMGDTSRPESILIVPMIYEDVVHGLVVVSAYGRDRFDQDDETTLSIFAAWAAQAMVNAGNLDRLHRQQAELELQLEGQRRLLEVNERLLLSLDLGGVLDLIADSLKAIVPVRLAHDLPRRSAGRRAPRGHRPRRLRRDDPRRRGPDRQRPDRLGHRSARGHPVQPGPPRPAQRAGAGHAVRARIDDRRAAAGRERADRHAQHRADGRARLVQRPTSSS